jgi:hypothetical protein
VTTGGSGTSSTTTTSTTTTTTVSPEVRTKVREYVVKQKPKSAAVPSGFTIVRGATPHHPSEILAPWKLDVIGRPPPLIWRSLRDGWG